MAIVLKNPNMLQSNFEFYLVEKNKLLNEFKKDKRKEFVKILSHERKKELKNGWMVL